MSAGESLSEPQFRSTKDIGYLESRDYPGNIGSLKFRPGGESDQRVKEIMKTARTEGIREPITIKGTGGRSWLHDGHHRYVAAKRLRIDVPVRDERP